MLVGSTKFLSELDEDLAPFARGGRHRSQVEALAEARLTDGGDVERGEGLGALGVCSLAAAGMVTVAVPLGLLLDVVDPVGVAVVLVVLVLDAADPDGVGPASAPLQPASAAAQAAPAAAIHVLPYPVTALPISTPRPAVACVPPVSPARVYGKRTSEPSVLSTGNRPLPGSTSTTARVTQPHPTAPVGR